MSLKRRIFLSFLIVALLPLIAISYYLYRINIDLAFNLYKQNLYNSTEIQTDIIEEQINRMIVRAGRFASARTVQAAVCSTAEPSELLSLEGFPEELQKFTDETLDSIEIFTLADTEGRVLYSSGSNVDSQRVAAALPEFSRAEEPMVTEILLEGDTNSLAIVTPVVVQGTAKGVFVVVFSNDYFLKTISSHRQVETSNAFIFCRIHQKAVESKRQIAGSLETFAQVSKDQKEGSVTCEIGGENSVAYYRTLTKTQWLLVNTIPVRQVHAAVYSYGLVTFLVFALCLLVIVVLSRAQSRKILQPFNRFLDRVEEFFVSGTGTFLVEKSDKGTEIGYLAEKFAGMASDITAAQEKLRESNYLYDAILHATYDLRIVIDYGENRVTSSNQDLDKWFSMLPDKNASEKAFAFFERTKPPARDWDADALREMVSGCLDGPGETEVCCHTNEGKDVWYRMIAVPILSAAGGTPQKMVLHLENITEKKQEVLRLLDSSQRDPLCGLLNRGAFFDLIEKLMGQKTGKGAMFFVDLDHFKEVNDHLGHSIGDEVLVRTAQVLTEQFRATDLVARLGGDEFLVFAPGMSSGNAQRKAAAIVEALQMVWEKGAVRITVSASVGVCVASQVTAPKQMAQCADTAMYEAKEEGRSRYCIIEMEE